MAKAIQALREQRTAYAKEARNILDTKTGKDWTKEAAAQVDDLYAKIDDLDGQIERFERALTLEDSLDGRGQQRAERTGRSADEETNNVATEKAIFDAWCRGGMEQLTDEQREYVANRKNEARRLYGAQSVGTGSQGGFLVPRDFSATLLEKMAAYGGVRSVANVIQTDGGN
jgi:HK97 family phage major capsid protein